MEDIKTITFYVLRAQIKILYYFFLTPWYSFFVLFVIFGNHCTVENSALHTLSITVVRFVIYSLFFFLYITQLVRVRGKITVIYRKSIFKIPGPLKGWLFLFLFIFTISLLNFIDIHMLHDRLIVYSQRMPEFHDAISE